MLGEFIKKDFPILTRRVNGKRLVYLDNAATSQKPRSVIDAISDYYSNHNANVHRGIHTISEEATEMYEAARVKVQKFINARHTQEIIFTRGTTESINFVANAWGKKNLKQGDEVAFTLLEHHSNFLPWQILAREKNLKVKVLGVDERGFLEGNLKSGLSERTKILAISHASNFLGTIQPLKDIIKEAHSLGILVAVDGAQAVPHMEVDVQSLNCDFYSFSGHKMLGPMGIGVLYVRKELFGEMEPYQVGGGMIKEVFVDRAVWDDPPARFEAGTPNVAGAIGLAAAVDYLNELGMDEIREHEKTLLKYALEKLGEIENVKMYGPMGVEKRTGLVSFNVEGIHPHDLSAVLDTEGVAIRSGHHCTMPIHTKLGLTASARASFYLYNSVEDVEVLIKGIRKAKRILLGRI